MTLKKLATQCLKAGPAICHDINGNEYFGYVIFIRNGLKFAVMEIDEDIVMAQPKDTRLKFIISELRPFVEYIGGIAP